MVHHADPCTWTCTPQVAAPNGEVIITNDGATILQKMTVTQPAAKMLVELSKSQVSELVVDLQMISAQPQRAESCMMLSLS